MPQTSFFQKIGLFFFALVLTIGLLEIGLRCGGWLFLAVQERANRQNVSQGKEYRILCVGESTTALGGDNAYPRQLERILNSRQKRINFKVINKGVPATTTDQILARVENYFSEYHPQMVVAMMGINDPQNPRSWTWRDKFSRHSKVFKLLDMIIRHWQAKNQKGGQDYLDKQIAKIESQAAKHLASRSEFELVKANLYRGANRPQQEKAAITKALSLDNQNSDAWFLLGIYYERQAESRQALTAFQKAYTYSPGLQKVQILERMAQCYILLNEYESAAKIYREILDEFPAHPDANGALGGIFVEQKNYSEAVKYFVRQLAINPQSADIYGQLAFCYRRLGQPQMVEKIFNQGLKARAVDEKVFYEWGALLLEEKKYFQAQKAFEESLRRNPDDFHGANVKIYEQLLQCYEAQQNADQVAKIRKIIQKKINQYNSQTQENYRKLIQIAGKHRVPILAVQYPHRPVDPLREMLASQSGVVFVDNQKVFTDALAVYPYDEIFSDRFAGDFGHCTSHGNALLAGNVADHILKLLQ